VKKKIVTIKTGNVNKRNFHIKKINKIEENMIKFKQKKKKTIIIYKLKN